MITVLVEGHSEVESVPLLIRRFLAQSGSYDMTVNRPIRVKRYQVVKSGELERIVRFARLHYPNDRALMLILDADDDCPKELAPLLLQRLQQASGRTCSVVLARAELESWFLASIESLRGHLGIRMDASPPSDPEEVRAAKGWLTRAMQDRTYVETDDQPAFAAIFDFNQAYARCRSFRKFCKDIDSILLELTAT